MHGELMEFSDMLHRQLKAKDAALQQLRQELVMLRGPVSYWSCLLHLKLTNCVLWACSLACRSLCLQVWVMLCGPVGHWSCCVGL